MDTYTPMTQAQFDALVAKEHIVQCPCCDAYSAYCWDDVNMDDEGQRYDNCTTEPEDIWHIPSASCFEWQCGQCRNYLAPVDSPILAECYTHVEVV